MNDKLALLNERTRGQFSVQLRRRRDRGDTLADLQYWVRSSYGMAVSHESIRQWCLTRLNGHGE